MNEHKVVNRKEWADAREQLLLREKEHTRLGDELARQRRKLPWARIEKEYRFETDDGTRTLVELFDGRSQLLARRNPDRARALVRPRLHTTDVKRDRSREQTPGV
jgi:predicted dithiol-disulfide oxidoreductase (DUF899 family)